MNCPKCRGKVEATLAGHSKSFGITTKPQNPITGRRAEGQTVMAGVHVVYECEECEVYIHWHRGRGITEVQEWHPSPKENRK